MSPSFAIVTACLDASKTIGRTIRSVADGVCPGDEYVIVDGGSKDNTLSVIDPFHEEFSRKGARLLVSSETDDGIYDAMNKGISRCTGEVIGLINADDWYAAGAFAAVRRAFDETDAEIVYGSLNYFEDGTFYRREVIHHDFLHRKMIPHPTCFVRREVYERLGAFTTRYRLAGDYEFMLRCRKHGVRFFMIPEPVANFSCGGRSDQGARSRHETLLIQRDYGLIGALRYRLKLCESWIRLLFRGG